MVILGNTGRNFAAGMSGGEAYVLDESGEFESLCNPGLVSLEQVTDPSDIKDLHRMIKAHADFTGSSNGIRILKTWDETLPRFIKVMPNDYKRILQEMKTPKSKMPVSTDG